MVVNLQRSAWHGMLSLDDSFSRPHTAEQRNSMADRQNTDQTFRVLLLTAYRWLTTTRAAHALSKTGVSVDALCPAGHTLIQASFVDRTYRYNPLTPLRSLRNAIAASQPDLIIPADDLITAQVHKLFQAESRKDSSGSNIRGLIGRSLGDPEKYSEFYVRSQIAAFAQSAGLFSPVTRKVTDENDLFGELKRCGYPAVLKTDGSSGGAGVAIVYDESEAKRAFRKLSVSPGIALTLKRLIADGDANLVLPCLLRNRPQVSIQPYIPGRQANIAVACWEGSVLADVCVEVLSSNGATGPARVVRVISHAGMSQAARAMVAQLKLSGLCGFDFVLDQNNAAHLIDFNPRATQTCHLISADGIQPLASLIDRLRGRNSADDRAAPYSGPIVLFPHGFMTDAQHSYAEHAFADLPGDAPELVRFGIEFRRSKTRWLARAIQRVSRKPAK